MFGMVKNATILLITIYPLLELLRSYIKMIEPLVPYNILNSLINMIVSCSWRHH